MSAVLQKKSSKRSPTIWILEKLGKGLFPKFFFNLTDNILKKNTYLL